MKLRNFFLVAAAAAFVFAACEPATPDTPNDDPEQETPADPDTPSDEFTSFADFNAAEVSTEVTYKVTGVIVSIEELNQSYQNATLTLADASGAELYVYRMGVTEDAKIEELGLTVGDVLVVQGNRGEYNGKVQLTNGVYVSHEDKEAPVPQITDIGLEAFNALSDSNSQLYRISGTITEIGEINTQHQNVNVRIQDDAGAEVYIYRLKVADDSDKTLDQLALKVGDVLTVVGNKGSYNNDPQMVNGKYESHVAGTTPPVEEEPDVEIPANAVVWTIGSANQNWAAAEHGTYGAGYAATVDGIKVAYYQHENNNAARTPDSDHIRVYQNSALVISAEGKKIKFVQAECTASDKVAAIKVGETNVNPDGTTLTWTGELDTFEAIASAQIRIKKLTILAE